uniref:Reverse transcriptase zinc-binding domain-containing protein n=1 Tax=Fagus sylvatica TaxID=28930 RepID=A0A2N9FR16_FAGSY
MGSRVRFWQDKWCRDMALKDRFPMLFTCSTHCEATIDSVLVRPDSGGVREWNFTFVRGFNDWEVDVVVEFFLFLTSNIVTNEGPDRLRWKLQKDGAFDSRSFYYALKDRFGLIFPWKSIWAFKAPQRVSFFVWTAAWGRILTCDNLMRRDYTMAGWCLGYSKAGAGFIPWVAKLVWEASFGHLEFSSIMLNVDGVARKK